MHDPTQPVVVVPRLLVELFDSSHYTLDPLSAPHFLAALIIAVTGLLVYLWEGGNRISRMFAGFSVLFTLWAAGRGVLRLIGDPGLALVLFHNLYAIVALAIPLLLQFVLVLLRREARRKAFIRFNWLLGILFAIASVGTNWVVAGVRQFTWGLEPAHGVLGAGMVLWLLVVVSVGLTDVWLAYRRTLPDTVEHRRVRLFGVAVLSLCVTIVDFLTGSGVAIYPFGFATVLIFVLLTAYITRHYGLVEVTAQLAASEIAAMTRGALLILDCDGIVRVVNERAPGILGRTADELVGHNARRFLGEAMTIPTLSLLAHVEGADSEKEIPYLHPHTGLARDLSLSVVAVKDPRGREVAYVCVLRDITEQKRAEMDRLSEGLRDTLTGLPNRAMFLGLLDAALQRHAQTPEFAFAVCVIGLDRMRVINEDLGYGAGDQVLAEVGGRLRKAIRPQDAVARIGGDEFGVLVRGHAGSAELSAYVEGLRQPVNVPLMLGDNTLYMAVCIGVASSDHPYTSSAELLRSAGVAMYRAKDESGHVHFLNDSDAGRQRTRLEAELRHGLEHDEFRLFYQPVLDLQERHVSGFEALIRWQHPERGLLLASDFIEFAEEVGLVGAIDQAVLRRACSDLRDLRRRLGENRYTVSINLSESALLEKDLVERVRDTLDREGLEPSALRIEVLERVAQIEPVRETLGRLRRLGVGLYIDDFGTGYSALSRLHELPVSALKIDRDFVRAMTLDGGGEKVIGGIVALARSLGLEIIAEGCGVAEEVVRLQRLGCRYVQGFYFSKGISPEAVVDLIHDPVTLVARFAALDRLLPPEESRARRAATP